MCILVLPCTHKQQQGIHIGYNQSLTECMYFVECCWLHLVSFFSYFCCMWVCVFLFWWAPTIRLVWGICVESHHHDCHPFSTILFVHWVSSIFACANHRCVRGSLLPALGKQRNEGIVWTNQFLLFGKRGENAGRVLADEPPFQISRARNIWLWWRAKMLFNKCHIFFWTALPRPADCHFRVFLVWRVVRSSVCRQPFNRFVAKFLNVYQVLLLLVSV